MFCILTVLLSKSAVLYTVAVLWRGSILMILTVRLYVKCTRGTWYLKSCCSLSSLTWRFFRDVYTVQIQVFVTSTLLQGHTSFGSRTVLYRIRCACSRKKNRPRKSPLGEQGETVVSVSLYVILAPTILCSPWNLCRHWGRGSLSNMRSQPRCHLGAK